MSDPVPAIDQLKNISGVEALVLLAIHLAAEALSPRELRDITKHNQQQIAAAIEALEARFWLMKENNGGWNLTARWGLDAMDSRKSPIQTKDA